MRLGLNLLGLNFTTIFVEGKKFLLVVSGVGLDGNESCNTQNNIYSSNIDDIEVIPKTIVFHSKFHLVHCTFTFNMLMACEVDGKEFLRI